MLLVRHEHLYPRTVHETDLTSSFICQLKCHFIKVVLSDFLFKVTSPFEGLGSSTWCLWPNWQKDVLP